MNPIITNTLNTLTSMLNDDKARLCTMNRRNLLSLIETYKVQSRDCPLDELEELSNGTLTMARRSQVSVTWLIDSGNTCKCDLINIEGPSLSDID